MAKSVSDNYITKVINAFHGGISPQTGKGIAGSFKFGYNLDIHNRDGALTCQQRLVKESGTTITDLPLWCVKATDGSSYWGGDQGKIYKRTSTGTWSLAHTSTSGRVCGMWEWEQSNASDYIYFTSTAGLHRKPFPGASNWSDVEMTIQTLRSYQWHPLKQASGVMAIGNENLLGKVDYDGLFDSDALNLRPGHRIKCLEEKDDYIIIGSEKEDDAEEGYLWSWLITAENWIQKKSLPAKGINSIVDAEYFICQAGIQGGMYFSDMVTKTPLLDNPYANETYPDGVDKSNGLALLGFFTTPAVATDYPGIYSYGRKDKNRPLAFNLDYYLPITNASEIGCVEVVGGTILASFAQSPSFGVLKVDTSNKANAAYEALEFDGGYPHYRKKFLFTKVTMDALASSCGIEMKYKMDRAAAWTSATLSDGSTRFSTESATEAIFTVEDEGKIADFRLEMYVSGNNAPVVHSIVLYIDSNVEGF